MARTAKPENTSSKQPPQAVVLRAELARKIAVHAIAEGNTCTEIPGLRVYRRSAPTACVSAAYQPSLIVFLQGQKRINLGKTTYLCDGSETSS